MFSLGFKIKAKRNPLVLVILEIIRWAERTWVFSKITIANGWKKAVGDSRGVAKLS